jgi:thioredoxin
MVKEINSKEFKELIFDYTNEKEWVFLGNKPAVICWSALWCGPCKMIAPVLEELSKEFENKIDIYKIDVDKKSELASTFSIRSIPSVLFIPMNGQPQMSVGGLPKEKFKSLILEILNQT